MTIQYEKDSRLDLQFMQMEDMNLRNISFLFVDNNYDEATG